MTIHRIDPHAIVTLCGLGQPGHWRATEQDDQVTCRACLRVLARRRWVAQRRGQGKPPAESLGGVGAVVRRKAVTG